MISASLHAWLRARSTSQPRTRIMIRYRRRSDTNRDRAPTRPAAQTAGQHHWDEFWSGAGMRCGKAVEVAHDAPDRLDIRGKGSTRIWPRHSVSLCRTQSLERSRLFGERLLDR